MTINIIVNTTDTLSTNNYIKNQKHNDNDTMLSDHFNKRPKRLLEDFTLACLAITYNYKKPSYFLNYSIFILGKNYNLNSVLSYCHV